MLYFNCVSKARRILTVRDLTPPAPGVLTMSGDTLRLVTVLWTFGSGTQATGGTDRTGTGLRRRVRGREITRFELVNMYMMS